MKRFIIMAIIILLSADLSSAEEPDGFRGNKWGSDVGEFRGLVLVERDDRGGGYDFYKKNNDDMRIGESILSNVVYTFWNHKYSGAIVKTEGIANYDSLFEICKSKFGTPDQPNQFIERYYWFVSGKATSISLAYNKYNKVGTLYMTSTQVRNEEREYRKTKAAEGSLRGF